MTPLLLTSGVAGLAAAGFSARWNWWRRPVPGIPILMYHKVGDPPAGSLLKKLWVPIENFRRQMNYVKEKGYTPIVFKDLYQHWDKNATLPANPVLITFDDGYLNNFTNAFPVLAEFGFRATLFVVVQTVGWENKWHDPKTEMRIEMITWEQVKQLQKAGWEIGSHTMNHPHLPGLEIKEAVMEIDKSRRVLGEFLGEVPDTFAYPYGAGEDVEILRQKVKEAGYRVAVGVHPGKWTSKKMKDSPTHLPRIFVRGDEGLFDFHLQMTRGQSRL
jgi:peptidoglycan/xylan/chitin deacetylase (PgdA/CDA1 family)